MTSDFEVTRQSSIFNDAEQEHLFLIEDPLLIQCIGVGGGAWPTANQIPGFNHGKQFGYALLCYFVERALSIQRLPFCEDRIYTEMSRNAHRTYIKRTLEELTSARAESICEQISALYSHTQLWLNKYGIHEVSLRRELKYDDQYAPRIVAEKIRAEKEGVSHIEVEMDMLNSYGDQGCYQKNPGVRIEQKIKSEQVLYCSSLIGNRSLTNQPLVETGEWVIINPSPNGVQKIPTSAISFRGDFWSAGRLQPQSTDDPASPIVLRSIYRHQHERRYTTPNETWKLRLLRSIHKKILEFENESYKSNEQ